MSSTPSSSWAQGAPPRSRKGLVATAIVLGVLLIAVVVIAALALRGMLPFGATAGAAASEAQTSTLTLEPANSLGENPFAGTSLAATVSAAPTAAAPGSVTLSTATATGTAPGLYGGSGDPAVCKVDQLVAFLQANPAKGQAWVDALNSDPNLRWTNGTLTLADVPKYVATLTAVQLTTDTRVTNHGFSDSSGTAYPLQSLLQKGTAVLVDKFGVPRVKCNCGNPLLPPQPLTPPSDPAAPASENPQPSTSAQPCLPPPIVVPDGMGPENTCNPSPSTETGTGDGGGDPGTPDEECEANFDETTGRFDLGCPSNPFPIETTGEAWEGIGTDPVVEPEPSPTAVAELQVVDPTDPTKLTTIPTGCQANGQCTLPDDAVNTNAQAAAAAPSGDPSAQPSQSAQPPAQRQPYPAAQVCNGDQSSTDPTTRTGSISNDSSDYVDVYATDVSCASMTFLGSIAPGATNNTFFGPDQAVFAIVGVNGQQNEYINGDFAFTYN